MPRGGQVSPGARLGEEYTHSQELSDGTRLYVVLVKRGPRDWVVRFGVDGERTLSSDSVFFGEGAEEVLLVDGEDLGDRSKAPPGRLDILGSQVVLQERDEPNHYVLGIAVGGRAPEGTSEIRADGAGEQFHVDEETGLFCAARTWTGKREDRSLRLRADDPKVKPYSLSLSSDEGSLAAAALAEERKPPSSRSR